ncbi:hypothetical protein SAMN06265173_11545 [Thalassovita litoralis]|uniref:Uncharacterized protein n=1 Tax=Thalassovita litoralis TaxID=1010611 RepID=A0A521EAG0_9RHOB|nr:hypothetical protein SAMN06265173_11545 [Thalassovita litoralis]
MCLGTVKLTNFGIFISTRDIKISKNDRVQAVARPEVTQHVLNRSLRRPIGIDRLLKAGFIQNDIILFTVSGAGGGEDKILAASGDSGFNQVKRPTNVVKPIFTRV